MILENEELIVGVAPALLPSKKMNDEVREAPPGGGETLCV